MNFKIVRIRTMFRGHSPSSKLIVRVRTSLDGFVAAFLVRVRTIRVRMENHAALLRLGLRIITIVNNFFNFFLDIIVNNL